MQVGPYQVTGELGRGGGGIVYRATAPDGREVALKLLHRGESPTRLARQARETRLQLTLGEEEGFVPLLDVGEERGAAYLVMPFLAGGTLRERLKRGPLPIPQATALAVSLARTLGLAHARGIVHRDLKPENVLFAADGRALVADLGLAKHFDRATPGASQSVVLSGAGELRGTVGYVAPEQLRDAASVGAPADVFALGAILHECVAGAPAFAGETFADLLLRVENQPVPPLRQLRRETPAWLEEVVQRALARVPAARFPDGNALAQALQEGPARTRRAGSVRRWAGLGLVIALAAGALALAARPPGSSPTPAVRSPDDAPPPAPELPPECAGFSRLGSARLVSVVGDWRGSHAQAAFALAFSPRGDLLASGCEDGTTTLWAQPGGEERACLRGEASVIDLAWRADGAWLVTLERGGAVRAWDVATRQVVRTASVADGALRIAFDAQGALLCLGKGVTQLDLETGQARPLPQPPEVQSAWSASADGARVAGHLAGGRIGVWETATGRLLRAVPHIVGRPPELSANGQSLLEQTAQGLVLHRVDSGTSTPLGGSFATACAISPDDSWLLLSEAKGAVSLRPLGRASEPLQLEPGGGPSVNRLAFSRDGRRAAWVRGTRIRTRDLSPGPAPAFAPPLTGLLAVSPDEQRAAACSGDRRVLVLELASGRVLHALECEEKVVHLAFTGPTTLLVVDGPGGFVRWDLSSDERRRYEPGAAKPAFQVALSPDGALLATGGPNGAELRPLTGLPGARLPRPYVVGVGASGGRLQACTIDGQLHELDPASGAVRSVPTIPHLSRAGFLPDGSAVLGADGALFYADPGGVTPLGEHSAFVTTLALSPDGAGALTASRDGTVVLWELRPQRRERERFSLASARDFVQAAAFVREGFVLLTARGVLLRWADAP